MITRLATYAVGAVLLCLLAFPSLTLLPITSGVVYAAEVLDINTATADQLKALHGLREDHQGTAVQAEG